MARFAQVTRQTANLPRETAKKPQRARLTCSHQSRMLPALIRLPCVHFGQCALLTAASATESRAARERSRPATSAELDQVELVGLPNANDLSVGRALKHQLLTCVTPAASSSCA
jgi:hypothetical protein